MFRIAICDDEPLALQKIAECIGHWEEKHSIVTFTTGAQLLSYIDECQQPPDIVVCDVVLQDENGLDVSERIKFHFPETQIIFISGRIKHHSDLYRVEHTYFLSKDFQQAQLIDALNMCIQRQRLLIQKSFAIKTKDGIQNIFLHHIFCVEQRRRISIFHTKHGPRQMYGKLDFVMEQLDSRFVRCHQSYIANMSFVQEMTTTHFKLYNGNIVPISRQQREQTRQTFLLHIGKTI